jgi:hypothetical protein
MRDTQDLRLPSLAPVAQWLRATAGRVPQQVTIAARGALKALGVALYVALAIIVIALSLRFAGVTTTPFTNAEYAVSGTTGDHARSQELDGRAQEILARLGGTNRGFTPGGE